MHREVRIARPQVSEKTLVLITMLAIIAIGVLSKMDRAPFALERLLDPVRLAIPVGLLMLPRLRKTLGLSTGFAFLGVACVSLTIASEEFAATPAFWLIVPAYMIYAAMLIHASRRASSSSIAALAICLALAPVF